MRSVIVKSNKNNNTPYPKLMKGKETDNIYLMVSSRAGTIVHTEENSMEYSLGFYSKNWAGEFEDWNDELTLFND